MHPVQIRARPNPDRRPILLHAMTAAEHRFGEFCLLADA